ncbi:MAG: MFS transporter [Candidatus Accumulibacter sp.]|jgi:YNFM family putative membrane transporter|nr:MFS transporter [Accumulibacter sp.]
MSSVTKPPDPSAARWIRSGSADYRKAEWALFFAGFASYSQIYCVQPLLPAFVQTFNVSPAESSLALSLTTGLLAVSIVLAGAFSQALGRRGLMFCSMLLAAVSSLVVAMTPDWLALLAMRAVGGFVIGGVPAVAIAYLSEEIEPDHLGKAMGLYVAGTAFGGMMGRISMGVLTGFTSWRVSLGLLGVACLAAAIGFLAMLPPSRNFVPKPGFDLGFHLRAWRGHLVNRGLLRIYVYGFLITGVFVTLFNYTVFRLSEAPYFLSQTAISMFFLVYGFGIASSSVSGMLADRFGYRPLLASGFLTMLLGVLATLPDSLIVIFGGIVLATIGFFIAHAVASASIGPLAGEYKGHAASLYLLFYYMGSSIVGSVGGWFWEHGGWPFVVGLTVVLACAGLILVLSEDRIQKTEV